MKAIETVYAGHRFRSRLEARWAVFFDALGIKWLYEEQGYEFERGRYLPDFRLPDEDTFVEVKGDGERLDLEFLADFLASGRTRSLLVLGQVSREAQLKTPTHMLLHKAHDIRPDRMGWTIILTQVAFLYGSGPVICPLGISPSLPTIDTIDPLNPPAMPVVAHARVHAAYQSARSARFEHGESG